MYKFPDLVFQILRATSRMFGSFIVCS